MSILRSFLVSTLFVGWIASLEAAPKEDWPVERGASNEPDPVLFDRSMIEKAPVELLRNYPACYLYASTWYTIEADGTVESTTHEIIRLNNRRGIDQLGEHHNMTFRPAYEKLTLNAARVHKAAGGTIAVGPQHLQLRDTQTDYSVYDSTKELIVSFPDLEEGDVIETKWTTRGRNLEYLGQYFTRYQFGDERSPMAKERFGVRIAKGNTLKYAVVNPQLLPNASIQPETAEKDGYKLLSWRVEDRRPIIKEELLPSKEELRPGVVITTFGTWQEVAEWERRIRAHCWDCEPDLKKIVQQIKRDYTKPEEVARELTYWVRNNIRYVSTGDKHDFTPHTPAHIVKNRFGDCKDGVQLLCVLLKEAGIPSFLISLNVVGDGQVLEGVPSPQTTHAILLTTIDGKDHWIDTTASRAAWDYLPKGDRDRFAYAVDDKTVKLLRTPRMTADDNRTETVTKMNVDAGGTSHNIREMTFFGEAALDKRDEWLDVSEAERRRTLRTELLDSNGKAKLTQKIEIDEKVLRRFHEPVKATIEYEISQHLHGTSELDGSISDNSLWTRLLNVNVDAERTQPIEMKEPFETKQTFIVAVPPGFRLEGQPENKDYATTWGRFRRTVVADRDGRKWTVLFHTRIEKTRIEKADFEAFLTFQEKITGDYRIYLTMKTVDLEKATREEVRLLRKKILKDPKDSAPAKELARLHIKRNEKEKAAEVILAARGNHPDDRSLIELAIQVEDGIEAKEPIYRELIEKFPGVEKYPLDLAALLIDAERPKKAQALLQPLTKSASSDTKAHALFLLAKISLKDGEPQKALEQWNDAKLADADFLNTVEAHDLGGSIYEALKQFKNAVDSFELALAIDDKDAETLESLVRVNDKKKDRAAALKYLRHYVDKVEETGSNVTAAEWYLKLGRLDDAEEMIERDQPKGPSDRSYCLQGLLDFRRNKWEKAVKILQDCTPLEDDALHALIVGNLMLGRLSEAISWGEKSKGDSSSEVKNDVAVAKRIQARRDAIRNRLARASIPFAIEKLDFFACAEYLHSIGRTAAEVEGLLSKALSGNVEWGEPFGLRAELLIDKGRLSKALIDAERAVALGPNEAMGFYVRGRVRLERERPGADDDLRQAVRLSGEKNPRMLHWLATALVREKRYDEAKQAQMKAAKGLPDDAEIEEQLREIEKMLGEK